MLNFSACEPLRGFQIGTYTPEATLSKAANLGANVVRWQVVNPDNNSQGVSTYRTWWYDEITRVIEAGRYIHEQGLGLKLVVDMHTAPLGTVQRKWGSQHWVLTKAGFDEWTNLWIEAITRIEASGYGHTVAAYDLLNEPAAKSTRGLWVKYRRLIYRLRKVTQKPLIIAVARRGIEDLRELDALPFKDVWVQFHYYKPNQISYFGVHDWRTEAKAAQAERILLRRARRYHRRKMRPARIFQQKHGARIFVGEVGYSAFNPDSRRATAFRTALKQMNRWDFDWCVHALDEWQGWQPTGQALEEIRRAL